MEMTHQLHAQKPDGGLVAQIKRKHVIVPLLLTETEPQSCIVKEEAESGTGSCFYMPRPKGLVFLTRNFEKMQKHAST